jgi:hypothetical protein
MRMGTRASIEQQIDTIAAQVQAREPGLGWYAARERAATRLFTESPGLYQEYRQAPPEAPRQFSQPPPPPTHASQVYTELTTLAEAQRRPGESAYDALDRLLLERPELYDLYRQGQRRDAAGISVVPAEPTRRMGGPQPIVRSQPTRPAGNPSRVAAKLSAAFSERRIPGAADLASVLVDAASGRA